MLTLSYSSNNSGGSWWLGDDDWRAMERAGWAVKWYADQNAAPFSPYKDGRFLGALASHASIAVSSVDDAKQRIREWEAMIGTNAADEGCNCCGRPHYFTVTDADDHWIADPVEVHDWTPSWS